MPWKECSSVSEREEFVRLASHENVNISCLCARFGVSRKTGYKWLMRYREVGRDGLRSGSRRPWVSPRRSSAAIEQAVLALRKQHPAWGGRKLRRLLQNDGHDRPPAASTITEILRRHGCIQREESLNRQAMVRFEHPHPNDLWQMDFKGPLRAGAVCVHPLSVLDDHSRFCLALRVCPNTCGPTVQSELTQVFRTYGLPRRMLMDNGSPWGADAQTPWTRFTVWLLRLSVNVTHGRPRHPQTQGKDERLHRTLEDELLRWRFFHDAPQCQRELDAWRQTYNLRRPHEALNLDTPASRYVVSPRAFPESLPPIEYPPGAAVRRVRDGGRVCWRGHLYRVGEAFCGMPVAVRSTDLDGLMDVYFCATAIARLDLHRQQSQRIDRRRWPAKLGEPAPQVPPDPLLGLLSPQRTMSTA